MRIIFIYLSAFGQFFKSFSLMLKKLLGILKNVLLKDTQKKLLIYTHSEVKCNSWTTSIS